MDYVIRNRLNDLTARGNELLRGMHAELQELDSPKNQLGKELLLVGAGEFVSDLFGSRKAGGRVRKLADTTLKQQQKNVRQTIVNKYGVCYRNWLNEVLDLLSHVSIAKPKLVAPGNSSSLVSPVSKAQSLKSLDARIQHVLRQLQFNCVQNLVWNSSLPKELPKPVKQVRSNPQQTLSAIEHLLRRCIERELKKTSPRWWEDRIELQVRRRAEGRKARRERVWPWYPPTSDNLVDYLDFSDYQKIILDPQIWTDVFSAVFNSVSFVESRLSELDPVRNDIAHSRQISDIARDKLRIYADEFKTCIDR